MAVLIWRPHLNPNTQLRDKSRQRQTSQPAIFIVGIFPLKKCQQSPERSVPDQPQPEPEKQHDNARRNHRAVHSRKRNLHTDSPRRPQHPQNRLVGDGDGMEYPTETTMTSPAGS